MPDILALTDTRTGKQIDVPIRDGTIRAMDLRALKADADDFGLMTYDPAFMNTASCRSAITYIDGDRGILRYRGYPIEQLAERSTFLETAYLLIAGELPTPPQLADFQRAIARHTLVPENIRALIGAFRHDAHPMSILLSAVGALGAFYPDSRDIFDKPTRALQMHRLLAKVPTIGAFTFRHTKGWPVVYPDDGLSYPANFLQMLYKLTDARFAPSPVLERALDVLFILHADHEQNCSTNAMRSIGSSQADPYSATAGAIAALYGPLHGGANEAVLRMLDQIGTLASVPAFIKGVKAGEGRLMGFVLRPAREDHQARRRQRVPGDRPEPAARHRARARTDRARGRVLRLAETVSERRFLFRADLPGDGAAERDVHGAVRRGTHRRMARAVGGDAGRPGTEDRAAAADLHRCRTPRLRAS